MPDSIRQSIRSLSASALDNFDKCPARWAAESHDKIPQETGDPANQGNVLHAALEEYVPMAYPVRYIPAAPTAAADEDFLGLLLGLVDKHYLKIFGTNRDYYDECIEMARTWYDRTEDSVDQHGIMHDREVISVENRSQEPVIVVHPLGLGELEVPITFIMDRLDVNDDGELEVVDYKTVRAYVTAEEMRRRIQPRLYAAMARQRYPQIAGDRPVWVSYELLRHGRTVSVSFTPQDDVVTLAYIRDRAEQILRHPLNVEWPRTINKDCGYCILAATCPVLQSAQDAGTIDLLTDPLDRGHALLTVQNKMKALKVLEGKLSERLMRDLEGDDLGLGFTDEALEITLGETRSRRAVDMKRVEKVLSADQLAKYAKMSVKDLEEAIKSSDLPDETKAVLKSAFYTPPGSAKIVLKAKNDFDPED